MIKRVISGGQSGADLGGLKAAKAFMIETGGLAPKYFKTENGMDTSLGLIYGLTESHRMDYRYRTIENVKNSDGTIIFMYRKSVGSVLTQDICSEHKKPCLIYQAEPEFDANEFKRFAAWIQANKIEILNIAGNRESVSPGIERSVMVYLSFCFNYLKTNS